MGQKSRNKKDRQKHHRPTRQPASASLPQPIQKETVIPSLAGGSAPVAAKSSAVKSALNFGEQTEYVRSDIRRIVILLAAVAVLLTAATVINRDSSLLKKGGRQLASFMKLQ